MKSKTTENGYAVMLDQTLFVPQAGGQPADRGTINGVPVIHVEAQADDPESVLHVVESIDLLPAGCRVQLRIDAERRRLNSRFHTAGHLLALVMEQLVPGCEALQGHHWPGEARVEFTYSGLVQPDLIKQVEIEIARYIQADLPVRGIFTNDNIRFVQIGDHRAVRCGGTHSSRLSEIGSVVLRNAKVKNGRLRIGYDVAEAAIQWFP